MSSVRGEFIFMRVRDRVLYFYFCLGEFIVYRINRLINRAEVVFDGIGYDLWMKKGV
jgi:hypothetical protein